MNNIFQNAYVAFVFTEQIYSTDTKPQIQHLIPKVIHGGSLMQKACLLRNHVAMVCYSGITEPQRHFPLSSRRFHHETKSVGLTIH